MIGREHQRVSALHKFLAERVRGWKRLIGSQLESQVPAAKLQSENLPENLPVSGICTGEMTRMLRNSEKVVQEWRWQTRRIKSRRGQMRIKGKEE